MIRNCDIVIPFCVPYIGNELFKEYHRGYLFQFLITWVRYRAKEKGS